MAFDMDNSIFVTDWIYSFSSKRTKIVYRDRWQIWLEYCAVRGLPQSGEEQLEDIKQKRASKDNEVRFFYDNEVPKFYQWLRTEYKQKHGRNFGKPLSEASALSVTTAVRSFFSFHRYPLQIKKEALPSSEKVKGVYKDHQFDIYQLRDMFKQGDLMERTVLACGKDLALRASDFTKLERDTIDYYIKAEKALAEKEAREPDIVEFELITQKEKEPASCHLSKETVGLVEEYIRTYPQKNGYLFPIGAEALTDLLRRLAEKAKITIKPKTRIRWHCLRKHFITVAHGKVTEPVLKYMTGKHIGKDLKTYIQGNREAFKAFKLLEQQLSLTKSNGNGGSAELAKQLDELKKATFKQMVLLKLIEKVTPKEQLEKALKELAEELGFPKVVAIMSDNSVEATVKLDTAIDALAEAYEKKDLERILKENGNNNH